MRLETLWYLYSYGEQSRSLRSWQPGNRQLNIPKSVLLFQHSIIVDMSNISLFWQKKDNGFSARAPHVVAGCSIDKSRLTSTSHTSILKVILAWKFEEKSPGGRVRRCERLVSRCRPLASEVLGIPHLTHRLQRPQYLCSEVNLLKFLAKRWSVGDQDIARW